jgi:pyruvate/2-oxoglutarate dehydrogenase complex dihydrolipoamide dehydrogenase (E3) component
MPARHFDAIVIGGGQAGVPLARTLARAGRRTALVERDQVGGTCVNRGCTPSKTMVASAKVADAVRRGPAYGVLAGAARVSVREVRARKQRVVDDFRTANERGLAEAGVELVRARACFTGPRELATLGSGAETLTADLVFINTGARPSTPPVVGLDTVETLDSTSIMELDELPRRLVVLGGGYVGLEFAQMFRRFGSDVIVVQRGPQLLPREDPDVAAAVAEILREDGIEVLLEASAVRAERANGGARIAVRVGDAEQGVEGTHVLVAAGRTPNSDDLGLEAAGVETDERGYVRVNAKLETSAAGVYALGDVHGGPAFTHISYDDFRIVRANLLEGGSATTDGRLVPYTVFIDPQLGGVGLTEREARARGARVRVVKLPARSIARAVEAGETRGFLKAIVDADTDRILGCAMLAVDGGELMSLVQVAMMGELPYTALRDAVFSHPTLAESMNNLFASWQS